MKWSRVFCEKGWPIRETGRKSQPNGKLRHWSGCFHGKASELSMAPIFIVAFWLRGVLEREEADMGSWTR